MLTTLKKFARICSFWRHYGCMFND